MARALNPEEFRGVPGELLRRIRSSATAARSTRILSMLDEFPDGYDETISSIAVLVDEYRFDEIEKVLEEALGEPE